MNQPQTRKGSESDARSYAPGCGVAAQDGSGLDKAFSV